MTGGDWGIVFAGVGSIMATVFGFVLAFRRDTQTKTQNLAAEEREELEHRRVWGRLVMSRVIVPVRDYFAARGEAEPVDFDRWTKYPPGDSE